ncbi:phosphodiester glycosidase family protein [Cytobacillus sp. FJAT-54145]|uniref:Phosphodiester glycosidase family protein n=1 Tax=Cytobacillus spartinae TaxID=3299023 RepID=A0ABW6KC04_9BACI
MKKIIVSLVMVLSILVSPFSGVTEPTKANAATTPYVSWEGMQLVKGQIGKVDILKPINLWKRENNKLVFVRVLKPGEAYRVYQYSSSFGGQYGVGGPYFVTNIKGFVQYKTPSKHKLKLVNPELYGTKLSIGTVKSETASVIAPGVTQSEFAVEGSSGNQAIYKLDVDQKVSQITFETSLAKDQMIGFETVSSQASRQQYDGHYIIGGVNGDYFDQNGAPTDLTVHNGELVTTNTTPASDRTIFGVSPSGKALIGNPDIILSMSVNGSDRYLINSVNKRRHAGHLVLYTPYFSSNTMTNELGTEVILTNASGKLNGNNKITAVVKEVIIGQGSHPLQQGEYVLSGHGAGSEYLKTLKAGDQVEIDINYSDAAWNNIEQAIGGRYHLVKNGHTQAFNIAGAHPRTAIGIKADGSVFVIVVDGRQSHSKGVTLADLAKIMKDFGAVEAITFDGGGSSTMIARQPGDWEASVINKPSDGKERSVANSLFIVGLWKAGPLHTLLLNPKEITLFAGATYESLGLKPTGLDQANNVIKLKDPITWSSNVGTFNNDDSYTAATKVGKGTITGAVGSIKSNVSVNIVNSIDSIHVKQETILVEKNESFSLEIDGLYKGQKVVSDPAIYQYSVSNQLGTVNKGVFKAGNTDGSGVITVSYGSVKKEIKVIVGNPGTIIIEDFEGSLSEWNASGAKYVTVQVMPEKNYIKEGKQSLKVSYDFIGTTGTSGVYAQKNSALEILGTPKKIGMWVYGDGKGHWLRAQLVDSKNKEVQLDFTKNLDWTGWKYVEATIPNGLTAPYKLTAPIRYMQVDDTKKNKGQIFIDQIQAVY